MIAPWVIKGAMDGAAFAAYVEKVLVPEMQSPISATSTHPKNAGITSLLPDISQVKGGTL